MHKHSNPLEAIIDFVASGGADKFWINNAKDELNILLKKADELEMIKKSLSEPCAYAQLNEENELYDLRFYNNPYNNQTKVVPLYRINQ